MSEYIQPDQARSAILAQLQPLADTERVPLSRAVGRILAEPVTAPQDWPPFARAAMDGYAFRSTETPGTFSVVGTLYAGDVWRTPLRRGEALRIMTGAPLPPEFDTVLELEAVQPGPNIAVLQSVKSQRNIMPAGHEYPAGSLVLASGTRLSPIAIAQMAGIGYSDAVVFQSPKILVLVTGDEVVPAGSPLDEGHIYDATGPLIRLLASELGAQAELRYVADRRRAVLAALRRAADRYHLVITTGGVSVGLKDFLPSLLEEHFHRLFWRADIHPGKAMAAGLLRPGVPVLSLSGNPGATLTAWYVIVAPVVAALTRHPYRLIWTDGRLMRPYPKSTRETRYLKARFVRTDDDLLFDVIANQSSDALKSFADADGLVVIPHGSPPQREQTRLQGFWLPHANVRA